MHRENAESSRIAVLLSNAEAIKFVIRTKISCEER